MAKEYMVLTQKDRVFGGKFNPEKVQQALNQEVCTTTFPGMMGAREELVMFLVKG
jgi:hypothetical protein